MFYFFILVAEILTAIVFTIISLKILNRLKKLLLILKEEDIKVSSNIEKYERARKIEMGLMHYILKNEFSIVQMERFLYTKMEYVAPEAPSNYGDLLLQLIEEMENDEFKVR